jgi:hypothetical protein
VNYNHFYIDELVKYQMLMNLHFHVNHCVGLLDLKCPWECLHWLKL